MSKSRISQLRFLTGKHPKNYCIPCCKITAPSTGPNDKQKQIYTDCLKNHIWDPKTQTSNLGNSSRYIMSYGKLIEPGRLSFLPEQSLESLLFDNETDFVINTKYYLFGIEQLGNLGYFYSLQHALKFQTTKEFFSELFQKLKKYLYFNNLLGGQVSEFWSSSDDMLHDLQSQLAGKPSMGFKRWNDLFIDIAEKVFKVITLKFIDSGTVIYYDIPLYLQTADDSYIRYEISYSYLIILHNLKDNHWNPIYLIHKDTYFRTQITDKRLSK